MIESKLSPWIKYKTIAYSIVVFLTGMPIYLNVNDKGENEIIWLNFFIVLIVVVLGTLLIHKSILRGKFRVRITENKILLNQYTKSKQYEFDHEEIKGMNWQNVNRTYGGSIMRGPTISTNNQTFWIYFKDGSELEISRADYDNYGDMANWFFGYCKRKQIIRIDPLEVRKRSRYRRPEKVKKP